MKTRMKSLILPVAFLLSGFAGYTAIPDTTPGVPGDNFSLEGALELFKKSTSPEEFERLINSPDANVNNLDLNGDGDIDYIKVIDQNNDNVHAFIIQAVVSETESQDVAVIELEKQADGQAVLQIIGDADIYGTETIIEPTTEVRVNAGTSTARNVVNVWAWPSVQYVYSPYYSGWVSPWRWSLRPGWWNPWRPVAYQYYYPRWAPYRSYYSNCNSYRIGYAQRMYQPMRSSSMIVYNRHRSDIIQYRSSRNMNPNGGYSHYNRENQWQSNGNRSRNDGNGFNGRTRNDWSSGRSNTYQGNQMDRNQRSYSSDRNTQSRSSDFSNRSQQFNQRSSSFPQQQFSTERSHSVNTNRQALNHSQSFPSGDMGRQRSSSQVNRSSPGGGSSHSFQSSPSRGGSSHSYGHSRGGR